MATAIIPGSATVEIPQYSKKRILAVWAAATVPMALLAWVVAPAVAGSGATERRFAVTLIAALTAGLAWQFVLVLAIIAREQRTLRWPVVRDALWLNPPTDAKGRRGGRLWWWALVYATGFAVLQFIPLDLAEPVRRSFGTFLGSAGGRDAFHGNWGLFALTATMFLFNTVLGEELLFRSLLLPRMNGAFGRADWAANGVLMGLYHLHQPWSIPSATVAGTFVLAYPSRRYRSAWMGILVHSAQSITFTAIIFAVVLS